MNFKTTILTALCLGSLTLSLCGAEGFLKSGWQSVDDWRKNNKNTIATGIGIASTGMLYGGMRMLDESRRDPHKLLVAAGKLGNYGLGLSLIGLAGGYYAAQQLAHAAANKIESYGSKGKLITATTAGVGGIVASAATAIGALVTYDTARATMNWLAAPEFMEGNNAFYFMALLHAREHIFTLGGTIVAGLAAKKMLSYAYNKYQEWKNDQVNGILSAF